MYRKHAIMVRAVPWSRYYVAGATAAWNLRACNSLMRVAATAQSVSAAGAGATLWPSWQSFLPGDGAGAGAVANRTALQPIREYRAADAAGVSSTDEPPTTSYRTSNSRRPWHCSRSSASSNTDRFGRPANLCPSQRRRGLWIDAGATIQGIDGWYEITGNILGSGSFGYVYEAVAARTGDRVAVKLIPNSELAAGSSKERVRAVREVSALMSLRHPNVVALLDVAYDPGDAHPDAALALVMELMGGGTVDALVARQPGKRLPEAPARRLFQQLVDGVTFCHSRAVVHRDLKPGNLLLDAPWPGGPGGDPVPPVLLKVADFGLSAIGGHGGDDEAGGPLLRSAVGTLLYQAPEMIETGLRESGGRAGYLGPPADIFSCGCILFYMLAGGPPFQHRDARGAPRLHLLSMRDAGGRLDFPPHLSPGCRDLLSRLLHLDPAARIRGEDIFRHPWFAVDYAGPADYRAMAAVRANRAAVDAVFGAGDDDKTGSGSSSSTRVVDLPVRPRFWQHKEAPIDQFAFGRGLPASRGADHFVVDETLRFASPGPPDELVRHVAAVTHHWGFQPTVRGWSVLLRGQFRVFHGEHDFREPLEVLVDVLPAAAPAAGDGGGGDDAYVVEFRRVTGDPLDYAKFRRRMVAKHHPSMRLIRG